MNDEPALYALPVSPVPRFPVSIFSVSVSLIFHLSRRFSAAPIHTFQSPPLRFIVSPFHSSQAVSGYIIIDLPSQIY